MKIPLIFHPETIRHRLMLLSAITIGMVIVLITINSYQVISLEKDLLTMEKVDGLMSNILELRRYEKNILLKLEKDSVKKAMQSLFFINKNIKELKPELIKGTTAPAFSTLLDDFGNYKTAFKQWCSLNLNPDTAKGKYDIVRLRKYGRSLVNDGSELVRLIRKRLSIKFKKIMFALTVMSALIFSGGTAITFSHTKNILRRLASIRKATRDMAAGKFTPIHVPKAHDEITNLIVSFNRMGQALQQKQDELLQSKKMASIGTFSSGIAHEINNPLNNISLSADTLLEEFDSMDEEETKEILGDIMTQTERASKIVRNLLDFSRAHATEMEPLHIDEVLQKTTKLIANELRIHKIALETQIADSLPVVHGDFQKLQQVFLNLIINAEQAIGEYGRIFIEARIADNDTIRVDVSDTGPGIDQRHLEQIFDPFFTTKEAGKGTGLGLSIVYGIVKKHGGYIEVASKVGEGTMFSVYLPAYHGNESGEQAET
jgi:signal transduction histidine kinase